MDDLFEIYTRIPLDEEEDFIYDDRVQNEGRPEGDFKVFYEELDKLLGHFVKAAEERRKAELTHFSITVSVQQLIK